MILNRVYIKRKKYGYYFHPEIRTYHEFVEFAEANTEIDCYDLDNAEYFLGDLSHEEQNSRWYDCISFIMSNTREVLDNLDNFSEFKTRWNHYGKKRKGGCGCPPCELTNSLDKYNWIGTDNTSVSESFIN